jgi:hypothetical protein
MLEAREIELIHLDVDGELPPGERATLSRLLLASPEARALHDDLTRLARRLSELPIVEPPVELQTAILEAIPWRATSRGRSPLYRPLRIAAGIAVAALLAGTLYELGQPSGDDFDRSGLSGTMARPAAGTLVGVTRVDLEGLQGSVSVRGPLGARSIDFEIDSDRPVDVVATVGARENRYSLAVAASNRQSFPLEGSAADVDLRFFVDGALVGTARVDLSH